MASKKKRRKKGKKQNPLLFIFIFGCLFAACHWYAGLDKAPDPPAYLVKGIDVSHHQGSIDWEDVRSEGIDFVFIKATEGGHYSDPKYRSNYSGATMAGIRVGSYHFFKPGVDGKEQAKHFLKRARLKDGNLVPVLDIETFDNAGRSQIKQDALAWLEHVEKETGVLPIIYTMPSYAEKYLDQDFAKYPLWIASLKRTPVIPGAWKNCMFWQYSHTGRIDGIDEKVDLNYYTGDSTEFEMLVIK